LGDELSTTTPAGAPVGSCPSNCREAMQMVQDEVNRISRLPGPVERNVAITSAYDKLAQDMPENDWVRLASYVSVQGGCAMGVTQGRNLPYVPEWAEGGVPKFFSRALVSPEKSLDALGDANLTIFSSIYPPNRMAANCGYQKFKECVASGEISVDKEIVTALDVMNQGDKRGAADLIADYEQRQVVQPVYERWEDTFSDMKKADSWIPGDQTSIPIAKSCTRDNLVPLDGDISNPQDRVDYYGKLIEEMYRVEGK
jgi:hypothetical protein